MYRLNILEFSGADMIALLIALACMVIPVIILLFVVVTKLIIKNVKRNRKVVETPADIKNKYLALFGQDNIISISKNLNRVTIEVNDIEMVSLDGLRNLGVGVLISGNTIKCSSAEFAGTINE